MRAKSSSPSMIRCRRMLSAWTVSASDAASALSGYASAISACWRKDAVGDRSSCDASDTNSRWRRAAASRRSSIRFIVRASRPISSPLGGADTRRCRSAPLISSTSRVIRSTGANARPTTNHVVTPTNTTRTGTPISRRRVAVEADSSTSSVDSPTTTVTSSPSTVASSEETRKRSPSGDSTVVVPSTSASTRGASSSSSVLDARTCPSAAVTCTNRSSSSPTTSDGLWPPSKASTVDSRRWSTASSTPSSSEARNNPTSTTAPTTIATATTSVATTVVRRRTDPRRSNRRTRPSATVACQPVPGTAHRLDRVALVRSVDLVAQVADVDFDDVRVAVKREVPHIVEDVELRDDVALAAQKVLEYRELTGSQLDFGLSPPDALGTGVEAQVTGLEHDRAFAYAPTDERTQARDQDRMREGFGEVVVGAQVERVDLVPFPVLRGEHQHGCPVLVGAQGLAYLVSVEPGKHDVENDRVVRVGAGECQTVGAVVGHVDSDALRLQAEADAVGEASLVLDHEYAHRHLLATTIVSQAPESCLNRPVGPTFWRDTPACRRPNVGPTGRAAGIRGRRSGPGRHGRRG